MSLGNTFSRHTKDKGIVFTHTPTYLKLLLEGTPNNTKAVIVRNAAPEAVKSFFLKASQPDLDRTTRRPYTIDLTQTGNGVSERLFDDAPTEVANFIITVAALLHQSVTPGTLVGFRAIEQISCKIPSAKFHHDPYTDPNVRPLRGHIGISSTLGPEMEVLATGNLTDDEISEYLGSSENAQDLPHPQNILTTKTGDLTGFWSPDFHTLDPRTGYLLHRTHSDRTNIPENERRVSLLWEAKRMPKPGVPLY